MIAYKFNYEFDSGERNFSFDVIPSKKRVDFIRTHILAALEKEDKDAYNAFNFREMDFPTVIFQKPHNKTLSIYFTEQGKSIKYVNTLIKILFENPLVVNGRTARIFSKSDFFPMEDILISPRRGEYDRKYNLITPLILFSSKDKFPIYYSIITNKETTDAQKEEILKAKASRLIVDNLKYQVQKQIGYDKYEILDSIKIEWNEFQIRFIEYHKNEKKTPAIFGSFKCNWELPRFIGQKIGKGFGQVNIAKNFRNRKVA